LQLNWPAEALDDWDGSFRDTCRELYQEYKQTQELQDQRGQKAAARRAARARGPKERAQSAEEASTAQAEAATGNMQLGGWSFTLQHRGLTQVDPPHREGLWKHSAFTIQVLIKY